MTQSPALTFVRSDDERVVAGVCGGIAARLQVDPNLVRFVFALLALAGGAGILLYLALWAYADGRPLAAVVLVAVAAMALMAALGLSASAIIGAGLLVAGVIVLARRGGSVRPGGKLTLPGIVLVMAGAVIMLQHLGASRTFIGPGAVAGALLLVLVPWTWRLASERTERIRSAERAEVAARVHDSVLQTLALVQRHADDPVRVRALARRQERDLRRWLYGTPGRASGFADAIAEAVSDVEEAHDLQIELTTSGDAPVDEAVEQLVLAAREGMTNAAKHAGGAEVFVFAEVLADRIEIFVRDRGPGFDRTTVPGDRRGIADSIEARLERAGGTARIESMPGDGTEVELTLPRSSS